MNYLEQLLQKHPELSPCKQGIERASDALVNTFRQGGKLLVCGNGGSAADSEHIVGELMKGFRSGRAFSESERKLLSLLFPEDADYLAEHLQRALPAISLVSQAALITATANDTAPDLIFAQQVLGYGVKGDALLAISTSGNAQNVYRAAQTARFKDLTVIALTGRDGGRLAGLADIVICVPLDDTAEIQERHQAIYHALCSTIEEETFGS